MSGHSKWATTKRQKSITDAKRSSLFTSLTNNITIAAREGGDPEFNFKLRMAIDRAKSLSMPKDNIERAIKRGTGELEGAEIQELTYECFGPAGALFIIETLTDNKNRTISEIRHMFTKAGGSVGASGSVAWNFKRAGMVEVAANLNDDLALALIDAGADDIIKDDKNLVIYTAPDNLKKLEDKIRALNLDIKNSQLIYLPKEKKEIPANEREKIQKLLDALDECGDISEIYINFELS